MGFHSLGPTKTQKKNQPMQKANIGNIIFITRRIKTLKLEAEKLT
jgi:hypothetical protein